MTNDVKNSQKKASPFRPSVVHETRFYEAPTSFRNVSSSATVKERKLGKKLMKANQTLTEMKNLIMDAARQPYRRTEEGKPSISKLEDSKSLTSDNRVDDKKQKIRKAKLLSSSKIASMKLSKLASLRDEDGKGKKTADKYSKRLNNLTKENFALGSSPDSNTIAEELNSRATNSDARISEALSAGAHPGMLVLAGAVLGAAVALTVVLSRRAAVRRRDRYHRHENIEVHTLTPTTELW